MGLSPSVLKTFWKKTCQKCFYFVAGNLFLSITPNLVHQRDNGQKTLFIFKDNIRWTLWIILSCGRMFCYVIGWSVNGAKIYHFDCLLWFNILLKYYYSSHFSDLRLLKYFFASSQIAFFSSWTIY